MIKIHWGYIATVGFAAFIYCLGDFVEAALTNATCYCLYLNGPVLFLGPTIGMLGGIFLILAAWLEGQKGN